MINVALVGLRASGKSTVASLLAPSLELVAVDTDALVADRFSEASVADIWREHGESAWRTAEVEVASSVLAELGQVVSMGGGMPIVPAVFDAMRREQEADRLMVAYLDVAPEILESRMQSDLGDRPGLHGDSPVAEIGRVHEVRDPVYRSLADVICVVGGDETAHDTAARLLAMLVD